MERIYEYSFQTCPESTKTKNYDEFHKEFREFAERLNRRGFTNWMEWDSHVLHIVMILTPQVMRFFESLSRPKRIFYTQKLMKHWPIHNQLIQLLFTECDLLMRNLTRILVNNYHEKYTSEKEDDTYLRKNFPIYVQTKHSTVSDFELKTDYVYDTSGGQRKLGIWHQNKMIYDIDFSKKSHKSKILIPFRAKFLMKYLLLNDTCLQLCIQYLCRPIVKYHESN